MESLISDGASAKSFQDEDEDTDEEEDEEGKPVKVVEEVCPGAHDACEKFAGAIFGHEVSLKEVGMDAVKDPKPRSRRRAKRKFVPFREKCDRTISGCTSKSSPALRLMPHMTF